MLTVKVLIGLVTMVMCTVVANLLLKMGATEDARAGTTFFVIGLKSLAGLFLFGLAAVLYLWLLRGLPLNVAQALAAAQFVSVILSSWLLLSESVPPLRWVGIALITIGIIVVGLTVDNKSGI